MNVLVTGSSGFFAQHLISLLQNDHITQKIKCFDIKPFKNLLDFEINKSMEIIIGDILKGKDIHDALESVDCIIHCATYKSIHIVPDDDKMYTVNVLGTENLIKNAIEQNVQYFIFISTTDVICGIDPIYYGAENTTLIPKYPIYYSYSRSMYEAEIRVSKANNTLLSNETKRLRTLILRPTLLYGEGDKTFVTPLLKIAKLFNGVLIRVDNVYTRTQVTYAGNAAWACIKAKEKMMEDESIGGEEFFISDDTAIEDVFDFVLPFLKLKGYKLSKYAIPYWLLYLILSAINIIIRFIHSFTNINFRKFEKYNVKKVNYFCTTFFFNRNKSILRLNYEPYFNETEAKKRSAQYYSECKL